MFSVHSNIWFYILLCFVLCTIEIRGLEKLEEIPTDKDDNLIKNNLFAMIQSRMNKSAVKKSLDDFTMVRRKTHFSIPGIIDNGEIANVEKDKSVVYPIYRSNNMAIENRMYLNYGTTPKFINNDNNFNKVNDKFHEYRNNFNEIEDKFNKSDNNYNEMHNNNDGPITNSDINSNEYEDLIAIEAKNDIEYLYNIYKENNFDNVLTPDQEIELLKVLRKQTELINNIQRTKNKSKGKDRNSKGKKNKENKATKEKEKKKKESTKEKTTTVKKKSRDSKGDNKNKTETPKKKDGKATKTKEKEMIKDKKKDDKKEKTPTAKFKDSKATTKTKVKEIKKNKKKDGKKEKNNEKSSKKKDKDSKSNKKKETKATKQKNSNTKKEDGKKGTKTKSTKTKSTKAKAAKSTATKATATKTTVAKTTPKPTTAKTTAKPTTKKPRPDKDFDELLAELEKKSAFARKLPNYTPFTFETTTQITKPPTKTTITTTKPSTVLTILNEVDVRSALRNNPFVKRILQMANRKRQKYLKESLIKIVN